jgi:Tc5 transposase DNA-binding domain
MSSKLEQHRRRVQKAVDSIQTGKYSNATQAAKAFRVPPSTVRHRLLGRPLVTNSHSKVSRMTHQQELTLAHWVRDLQVQAMSPSHAIIRDIADEILQLRHTGESVGDSWTGRFIRRH